METSNKRRNFLLACGLGAVGAVSAVLMRKRSGDAAQSETAAAAPEPVKGYHVSEHVQHYYRSNRV